MRAEDKPNTSDCHPTSRLSIGWRHPRYTPIAGKIFARFAVSRAPTVRDAAWTVRDG